MNNNLANKILALTLENNGVACSLVKSNTNIYYNLKVDTATSKAIHYCTHCTNPDCKAIHKSLSTPLTPATRISTSQPVGARIFLAQPLTQNGVAPPHPNSHHNHHNNHTHHNSSHSSSSSHSNNHSNLNKLMGGANINFIFERRYPLVQLNGNLLSGTSGQQPTSPNSTTGRPLSPSTTTALTSALSSLASVGTLSNNQRQVVINKAPEFSEESGESNAIDKDFSFPTPLKTNEKQTYKSSSFSINFNRANINSNNNSNTNTLISRSEPIVTPKDEIDQTFNESFPNSLNNLNLRYKNILFLDQVIELFLLLNGFFFFFIFRFDLNIDLNCFWTYIYL